MKIISVVRDFELYNRLVKQNRFNQNAEFTAFDNNQENMAISKRYNSFLDGYDYADEDWFVFCHEDWELKEDLSAKLEQLDKNCLYGAIGVPYAHRILWSPKIIGQVEQCAKDGTRHILQGTPSQGLQSVGTFDCQCVIVHSSLVKQYHLRFDENLTFDLYVEDFCITAGESYKIPSKVLPIKCCHWSYGNVTERFYQQLQYLRQKHEHADNLYISIVDMSQITKGLVVRTDRLKRLIKGILRFVLQIKTTKSGKLSVKLFKIPVLGMPNFLLGLKGHNQVKCKNNLSWGKYNYHKLRNLILYSLRKITKDDFLAQKEALKRQRKESKHKLGIAYNVFDGEELLEASIKSVRSVASYIAVVYQLVSNFGEKATPALVPLLTRLKEQGLIDDLYLYEPEFDKTDDHYNEKRKRDIGLALAKRAGCDYFLSMDTDEFYHEEQLKSALEYVHSMKIKCSAVSIIEYLKKPIYLLVNGYAFAPVENKQDYVFYAPFIMKIHRFSKQRHNGVNFPCLVDPTRGLNCSEKFYLFPKHQIAMHHMSTIRKDLAKKYANSNLRKGGVDDSLSDLQSKILAYDYDKNTVNISTFNGVYVQKVDNVFNINIEKEETHSA